MFSFYKNKTSLILIFLCTFSFGAIAGNVFSYTPSLDPFYYARQGDLLSAFRIMKLQNIDINARDSCEQTLLMYAAKKNNLRMLKILLDQGANITARDQDGDTVLMYATRSVYETEDMVHYLLEQKDAQNIINTPGHIGRTPLMCAVTRVKTRIVSLLLAYGSDIEAKDDLGETAQSLAHKKNCPDVIKSLLFSQFLHAFWPDKNLYSHAFKACVNTALTFEYIEKINCKRTLEIAHPCLQEHTIHALNEVFIPYLYSYKLALILKCCWDYLLKSPTEETVLRIHTALYRLQQQNWMTMAQYQVCERFFTMHTVQAIAP